MLYSDCEGMGLARWLVLGLLLIGCTVGIGSAIAVTGPVVIDKPGVYELTKDILDTKAPVCIEIRCDNVVFDGKGHRIRGVDAANSAGVLIHGSGPISNVMIRNLVTEGWFYGIYAWGAKAPILGRHGLEQLLRHRPEPVLRLGGHELTPHREQSRRGHDRLDPEYHRGLQNHR